LDASALINVLNAGVLSSFLQLPGVAFAIGPQVRAECRQQREGIDAIIGCGLQALSDSDLPSSVFFSLLEQYGLGLGETESLALAGHYGYNVCTDDRRARKMCASALGPERVFGTARLLRDSVLANVLTGEAALCVYEQMKARGAFLPELPVSYFEG
jgi:predicted nucleic acid-binding protein